MMPFQTQFPPVYDYSQYYTDEAIGVYITYTHPSPSTDIFVGDEIVDCVFNASFNLRFDASSEYPFESQVMIAATCYGTTNNAITGGTGN
jgi:hypothetical protein